MDEQIIEMSRRENKWIRVLLFVGYVSMCLSFLLYALHEAFWWPPLAFSIAFLISALSRANSLSNRILAYRLENVEKVLERLELNSLGRTFSSSE
jgi:hypothetical protein